MITPEQIRTWFEAAPETDLVQREGGARLRPRFVAFLARYHPEILQRYLAAEPSGLFATEQLMMNALSEVTRTGLRATLSDEEPWRLIAEWAAMDEDAYELVNGMRG